MEEQILEEILKKNIKSIVSEKIDEEIEQKVNNFKKELEDRKDNYIAEIMKGIRVYHERDTGVKIDFGHESVEML